jgi:hypothetical protein
MTRSRPLAEDDHLELLENRLGGLLDLSHGGVLSLRCIIRIVHASVKGRPDSLSKRTLE